MQVFRTFPVARRLPAALTAMLCLALAAGLLWPALARANHDPFCYGVANPQNNVTLLTSISKTDLNSNTIETVIGSGNTGTEKTDGIAMQASSGVLFGSNSLMGERPEAEREGYIGTYNLNTAQFTPRANAIGWGQGMLGTQNLYDVSGMAFDPETGHLFISHVRSTFGHVSLLVRIDPSTGKLVKNAFGNGHDYVPLGPLAGHDQLHITDDIAIDPTDGQMYGIANNGRSDSADRLVKIHKATGAMTDVGPFGISDVEGMDFDPHGRLWVTSGIERNSGESWLFEVNKATGQAFDGRRLTKSYNYEALACMLSPQQPPPTATPPASPTPPVAPTSPPPVDPPGPYRLYLPLLLRQ
jgi:hypothetical protein